MPSTLVLPEEKLSADIKNRILNVLWQRGVATTSRQLKIQVDAGTVTLSGTLPSFYLRQLSLSCCRRIPGVFRLIDKIQVEWPDAPSTPVLGF